VVKTNKEEQRNEKMCLQKEIRHKEQNKVVETQNLIRDQIEIRKDIVEKKKRAAKDLTKR